MKKNIVCNFVLFKLKLVMIVLAIDPGPTDSAYVVFDGEKILSKGKIENGAVKKAIAQILFYYHSTTNVVIENIQSYGMAVGKEVFETCIWIGRYLEYAEQLGLNTYLVYRSQVKMHLCNSNRAKDANIRQALIDKYGTPGTKKNPNLIYNDSEEKMSGDIWSALAIATYFFESQTSVTK